MPAGATAVPSVVPFLLIPQQGAAPIPAAGTVDACSLYFDGTDLLLSKDGAAYAAVATGAAGVTLDGAYDFGGAGAGRTITVDAGAVNFENGQTSGYVLTILTQGVTLAGDLFGIYIDVGSNPTAGSNNTVGIYVISGKTSASGGSTSACAVLDWRGRQGIGSLSGALVLTTNANVTTTGQWTYLKILPHGTVTLGGALYGVHVDLGAVVAGSQDVIGFRVDVPATSGSGTRGLHVITAATDSSSSALEMELAGSGRGIVLASGDSTTVPNVLCFLNYQATATAGYEGLYVIGQGDWSSGGAWTASLARVSFVKNVTYAGTFSGQVALVENAPTANGAAVTLSGALLKLSHAPTESGGGSIIDTTIGLDIAMSPYGSEEVRGARITMSANARSAGLEINHGGTTAGTKSVALRLTGADESVCLEMTDGDTVGVSSANEGRMRYNATTQTFQYSMNGGAWTDF